MTRQDTHLDCSGLKTYSIFDRNSLVSHKEFARPWERGKDFSSFLDTLPSILAGNDIRTVIQAVATAAQNRCPVCFAMGGHVIKTGMAPVIIDLMEKQVITLVAMNGAGIIHDLEVALAGKTSEDVAGSLENGRFGMARETADCLNQAIGQAEKDGTGLGRAVGQFILDQNLPYQHLSFWLPGPGSVSRLPCMWPWEPISCTCIRNLTRLHAAGHPCTIFTPLPHRSPACKTGCSLMRDLR